MPLTVSSEEYLFPERVVRASDQQAEHLARASLLAGAHPGEQMAQ